MEWVDVARGMGIILVVYGHVLRGIVAAGVLSKASPLWLSDYTIYTFHMPLFFVLAGLNVRSSLQKGKWAFFLGKLWTIAYPYFLWSAMQGFIQLHMAVWVPESVNHVRSALFMESILWRPIAQFWFLYALFVCHMIAPLIIRHTQVCYAVGLASLLLSCLSYGQPFTYMLPFYVLGMLLAGSIKRWQPSFKATLRETCLCVGLFAVAEHLGRAASAGDAASIFSVPAAVLGIGMVLLFSRTILYANERLTRILKTVGAMSMTIYILHVLADAGARLLLKRFRFVHPAELLLVGVIAGVGLPMAAHTIFGKLKLLTPLGLAPWAGRSNSLRGEFFAGRNPGISRSFR